MKQGKQHGLVYNTIFLYVLTFSNYIFAFITIPYQTRVLGPEVYGIIGFALAFYTYFMLFFDFGFILSGTKLVVENKDNRQTLSQIFSAITAAKFILLGLACIILLVLYLSSSLIQERINIILLYVCFAFLTGLIPDYLYRGLEDMKTITIRTVGVRFLFCLMLFVFMKQKNQYWMIPTFQIIGTSAALIWVLCDLRRSYNISFVRVKFYDIIKICINSFQFFASRIASTIYSVTNTVILGYVYPQGNTVGYYTSADKFKTIAQQACSPVADSFYPYMIRTKNYKALNKLVLFCEIFIILACIICFWFAPEICTFVFGQEYGGASIYLRYMIPICAVVLPSYMYGFPALTALGKAKWANYSVEIATVVQVLGIVFLYLINGLNAINICITTIVAEYCCVIIRMIVFFKNYKKQ